MRRGGEQGATAIPKLLSKKPQKTDGEEENVAPTGTGEATGCRRNAFFFYMRQTDSQTER